MERIKAFVRRLLRHPEPATSIRIEREIDEELSFHLDMRTQENIAAGMSPDEARRCARERLGELDSVRRQGRRLIRKRGSETSLVGRLIGDLRQDLGFALRSMARSPGFTAVALIALMLGIGATTVVFSVVDGLLLQELPYEEPDRLVSAVGTAITPETTEILRERLDMLADVAFFTIDSPELVGPEGAVRGRALAVSERLFPLLGMQLAAGRPLAADDFRADAEAAVVVTDRFRRDYFRGRTDVIGSTLRLDGVPHQVVGVLSPGVTLLLYSHYDLFVPLEAGTRRQLMMIGRLAGEVSFEGARDQALAVAATLDLDVDERRTRLGFYTLCERVVGSDRDDLLLLSGAVSLVLLIAGANVANLSLARALGRRGEIAVRAALGAGRGRLSRQLLTESGVLAVIGGALGALSAVWGVPALLTLSPQSSMASMSRADNIDVDLRVLAFTVAVSLLIGVLSGLVPAAFASRSDLARSMAADGVRTGASRAGRRVLTALVVAEVAVSLVVLVASGLLVRAFLDIRPSSPGFDPSGKLVFQVSLPDSRYPDASTRAAFYRQTIDGLRALPGAAEAAAISSPPLVGFVTPASAVPEGVSPDSEDLPSVWLERASANYHELMDIALVRGRPLSASRAAAAGEIVVSETAVRSLFSDTDPLGKRVTIRGYWGEADYVVVGIGADTRRLRNTKQSFPTVWVDFRSGEDESMTFLVEARGRPQELGGPVRELIAEIDPRLPILNVQTMADLVYESAELPRFYMVLMSVFGSIAIVLALIGFYGMMAFSIGRRTRELGVRVALGASPPAIRRMVLRQGAVIVGIGIALGLGGCFAVTRLLESFLYGLSPTEPLTYASLTALVAAVGLFASYVPARRATRVDPLTALRGQ